MTAESNQENKRSNFQDRRDTENKNARFVRPTLPNSGNTENKDKPFVRPSLPNSGNKDNKEASFTRPTLPNSGNAENKDKSFVRPSLPNSGNTDNKEASFTRPTLPNSGNAENKDASLPNSGNTENKEASFTRPPLPNSGDATQNKPNFAKPEGSEKANIQNTPEIGVFPVANQEKAVRQSAPAALANGVFAKSSKNSLSEATSIHKIKDVAHKKVEEKKEQINTTKEVLSKELEDKIATLNTEKTKYQELGKTAVVESIDKKIEAYKKTQELVSLDKLGQGELNKLHNFIHKDIDNLAPEVKIKQYGLVTEKLTGFNKKQELKEEKQEVKQELKELKESKSVVDDALDNIKLDVEQQTEVLETEIAQLMARAQQGDLEKAKELQGRVDEYKKFTEKDIDKEYSVGEKKGLVMFLQSDEQKHKFLEQQQKYGDITLDSVVGTATGMVASGLIVGETLKTMGTGLVMNKAYSLFGEFGMLRNSIPGLANLTPSDNIDEYVSNIKNYTFSEEEKAKIEQLKVIQGNINNFQEVQRSVLNEVNERAFLEQRMALEFQIAENKKFLDSEIAKIDMMNFSEEEKTKQKEMALAASGAEEAKLREKLATINKGAEEFLNLENTNLLSQEQISKLATQTDILALTQNPANKTLLMALAAEGIDGRIIGGNLEVDVDKIRDFSLISAEKKALEAINALNLENKKNAAKNSIKEFSDVFIGKKGETDLERRERFKLIDNYLSSGATGMVGKVMLFFYQMFEVFISSIERLPEWIAASQRMIERNRSGIFIAVAIFVLVLTLGFSGNDSMSFIELNSKLYSMSNYSVETTGNMRYVDDTVKSVSQKLSILAFLMSLVVLYQIVIEIMNRYINFLKNGEDKSRVESFMLSILKGTIFLVFLGTVFKVFV